MSLISKANAICSKCSQSSEITIYKSINTAEDPALRGKVRDGSLFLWSCPHCGTVNLARYETLYHDPEHKIMLWLAPEDKISPAQMQAITNHTKAMGGYTLRLVGDMGELMEKVRIFDAGLDDAVVELCKWVTRREMASKGDPQKSLEAKQNKETIENAAFHFYGVEGEGDSRILILSFAAEGEMKGVKVGWNVYEDCKGILERNPTVLPGEGFSRIDSSWLASVIR